MAGVIEPFARTDSIWRGLAVVPRQPARAGFNNITPPQRVSQDAYDDFDLWLGLEGNSTVEILGRSWPLNAGASLLLPPGVDIVHRIDEPLRVAFFHFDLALGGTILRDARRFVTIDEDAVPSLQLPNLPALALLAPLDTNALAEGLLRAARRWDDVSQLQSVSLVTGALAEHRRAATVRPAGAMTASRRERGASAIDAALQYLEDNLRRPVFVADVAAHVRLSPTHLTRLFRAQLDESPMQALLRMRLTRALHLLSDPSLNIGEVAAACGFESLSFFTRVFTRRHGSPPTSYRRSLQKPRSTGST